MPSLWGKSHEEALRAAGRKVKLEKDRGDAILEILREANKIIVDGAVDVGAPSRFFQAIERFRYEKANPYLPDSRGLLDPREIAKIVIKELGALIREKRDLGKDFEQLEQRLNTFTSQTRREDSEATQVHKKTSVEKARSNELHDRQDDIDNLKNQISLLEGEKASLLEAAKNRVEEVRQELEATHAVEIENLKTEHDGRISDMKTANTSAENSLKAKYRSEKALRAECEGEIKSLQKWLEDEGNRQASIIIDLQTENNAQKAAISELISKHRNEQNNLREDYELDRKQLVGEMSEIKENHDLALGQMEQMRRSSIREQQKNQSTIREMEQRHQSIIRETDQRHQSTINNMELKYKSMIEQMREDHELERARWQSTKEKIQRDYKAEMDLMQKEQDSEIALMIEEHAAATAKMAREHESKQAQLIDQISEMKKDHASAQEKMRKSFEARKRELEAEFKIKVEQVEMAHVEERKRLRKDVDAYSVALLARDQFTPKPDNEIKARFLDLVQDVDALARLEWKANQKEWTNQVLQSLSPNQRPLKKQILQDTIWVILHESIFCSPFRVFGEEGQALETQWNGECGKGLSLHKSLDVQSQVLMSADPRLDNGSYTWPEPAMETERWRYVTVKECRASLKQPVPSHWDPRAKLKRGFKTSIDALRKELTSMLGEIADLDKDWVQAIEKMTLKAATIWLEFGMQRCRISVVMQGSNLKSAQERIRRAQESSLKMVVLPELKRFGNSSGQDLNIEEVIGGCDGQIVGVSMGR